MSQLALTLTDPESAHAPPAAEPGTYPCPCCGGRVVDEYTEGDALCCWCRDIDDPRLAERVRAARLRRPGPRRCCLARSRGRRGWTDPSTHGRFDSLGDPRTLHEALADLGLTTRPARMMAQKDVLDTTGAVLCTGTAGDVWAWLRASGRVG